MLCLRSWPEAMEHHIQLRGSGRNCTKTRIAYTLLKLRWKLSRTCPLHTHPLTIAVDSYRNDLTIGCEKVRWGRPSQDDSTPLIVRSMGWLEKTIKSSIGALHHFLFTSLSGFFHLSKLKLSDACIVRRMIDLRSLIQWFARCVYVRSVTKICATLEHPKTCATLEHPGRSAIRLPKWYRGVALEKSVHGAVRLYHHASSRILLPHISDQAVVRPYPPCLLYAHELFHPNRIAEKILCGRASTHSSWLLRPLPRCWQLTLAANLKVVPYPLTTWLRTYIY
jgi:hypothetical protein